MRRTLVDWLIKTDHDNRYFLTADVGWGVLEPLQKKMGERFINVGIAEQSMIGIAAGLALSGKDVYTFTMCSFYLRALEQIRNDICYQELPIKMIGVGIEYDYEHLGTTHYAIDDVDIMHGLRNLDIITPENKDALIKILKLKNKSGRPMYIRVSRFDSDKYFNHDDYIVSPKKYPHCVGNLSYMANQNYEKNQTSK